MEEMILSLIYLKQRHNDIVRGKLTAGYTDTGQYNQHAEAKCKETFGFLT